MTQAKDASTLYKEIEELRYSIKESQNLYSYLVDQYYELENPFPPNRPSTDENLTNDINQIQNIVENCLLSGDSKLLRKWLILPINAGRLSILSLSRELVKYYVPSLQELVNRSNYETEKNYYRQIIEALLKHT